METSAELHGDCEWQHSAVGVRWVARSALRRTAGAGFWRAHVCEQRGQASLDRLRCRLGRQIDVNSGFLLRRGGRRDHIKKKSERKLDVFR